MKTLKINNFGPIGEVEIEIGDMTVLIGPQAVGKSLFLQFLNLLLDYASIIKTLKDHGFSVKTLEDLLGHYLGSEMAKNWVDKSQIQKDGNSFDLQRLVKSKPRNVEKNVFYIPAQRVLIMEDGWPRPFQGLTSFPYVVKDFSEGLRIILEADASKERALFPQKGKLKQIINQKIQAGIFPNADIKLETAFRKRLLLEVNGNSQMQLPILFWSAGQREFMPLLLGLYYLAPASRVPQKGKIKTVIIEELEMGLHPAAINGVMLAVMELLHRGYKVVISTHSLHVVEMIWTLGEIKKSKLNLHDKANVFKKLFDIESSRGDVMKMAENCLTKNYNVFYFKTDEKGKQTISRNITGLDPSAEDTAVSGWGGLTEFSSNIVDIVSSLEEAG
jgi:predicted ATPase